MGREREKPIDQTVLPSGELIRVGVAAKILNVHPNTLRLWEAQGLISASRSGPRRDRQFVKSDVERLESNLYRKEVENRKLLVP